MNSNKKSTPSQLLEQVLATSNNQRQTIRITNLADLMRYATVTYSVPEPFVLETDADRFHYTVLRELFREVRFYFRQTQLGNPIAHNRLNRASKGLAWTALQANRTCVQRFISEIAREEATDLHFLNKLANTPAVNSFIENLQLLIKESLTNAQNKKPIS
jgi:hypothetical protein